MLVLGGVSHTCSADYALNVIYRRLEERPLDSVVDVVVVDPDPWQCIPLGRTQHAQMHLENYLVGDRLEGLLGAYENIAVIDDLFFKNHQTRNAVVSQEAWRSLALAVENHPDICTWWVIRHHPTGRGLLPELVRMSGNIRLNDAMRRRGMPAQPLSLIQDTILNAWNTVFEADVDWQIIQHPFWELLPQLMQRKV